MFSRKVANIKEVRPPSSLSLFSKLWIEIMNLNNSPINKQDAKSLLDELEAVLPRSGVVFAETDELSPILCKPKILPLKSITLQKIEEMEKNAFEKLKKSQQNNKT